ncbi:MAG: hypothetical protein AB8H79_09455 [Myxococcota bacterium]
MRFLWLLIALAPSALAHPMGRDEYSLRTGVEADENGIRVVVMGEIPVPVVITELGRASKGQRPTPAQVAEYTANRHKELMEGQTLTIDGTPVTTDWRVSPSALNGRAIDGFFVYVVQTTVPLSALDSDVSVVVKNQAWPDAPMVYDADVRARKSWTLASSSAPETWTNDAAQRTLTVHFTR